MSEMKLIMENWNNFKKNKVIITEAQKKEAILMLEGLCKEGIITEGIKDKLKSLITKGAPKAAALALALTSFLGATGEAQATIAVTPDVVQSARIDDGTLQSIKDQVAQNPDSMPHFEMRADQLVFSDEGARGIVSFLLDYLRHPGGGGMDAVRDLGGADPFFQELNDFMERANSGEIDQISLESFPLLTRAAGVLLNSYADMLEDGRIDRSEENSLGSTFNGNNTTLERELNQLMRPGTPHNSLFRQQARQPSQSGD